MTPTTHRCPHRWQPLLSPASPDGRIYVLIRRLSQYETCPDCGRLAHIGATGRRSLVSNEWVEKSVRSRAAECPA